MREFPVLGIARQKGFLLERVDYGAPETSGRRGGVQAGWPVWSTEWTLGTMPQDVSDEWEAMLTSLRGQQRAAFARDVRRPYPRAHIAGFAGMTRVGGGAFDGSATSWSMSVDADQDCHVTLNGVPAALSLSRLDYIGFKWMSPDAGGVFDRFALVRCGAAASASVSGIITVLVEPVVPSIVPGGAVAYLDRPGCMMKLTAQTELAEVDRMLIIKGSRIAAVQVLEA